MDLVAELELKEKAFRAGFRSIAEYRRHVSAGTWNEFLEAKYSQETNTNDPSMHCPHCDTVYRASEIKDGRCPFCWRLVE